MVWFGRRRDADGPPEACHPVRGVAAEAALRAEVHRGVRRAVQHEHLGVLGVPRGGQSKRAAGDAGVGGIARDGAQGAEQLPARRVLGHRPGPPVSPGGAPRAAISPAGSANASADGLTGRISQRGRRVPSGETWPAGRVSESHRW